MDDDVKQAIEELREEIRTATKARTPAQRSSAASDVRDARESLEDVLRREGYRLSQRDLDRLVDADDERRFNERLDKALADRAAREEGEEDEDEDADSDKAKPKAKRKPAAAAAAKSDEEEEWT